MDLVKIFSAKRLSCYQDDAEHRANFILIGDIAPRLGILEIATRNAAARILSIDDDFISRQTFGYWAKLINEKSIHNEVLNLQGIDFRKYAPTNKKAKLRNFYKVRICYDLLVTIRNRAFHFENLYKTKLIKHANITMSAPRISTYRNAQTIGIMPNMIKVFLDDILECFESGLKGYVSGGEEKFPPLTSQ